MGSGAWTLPGVEVQWSRHTGQRPHGFGQMDTDGLVPRLRRSPRPRSKVTQRSRDRCQVDSPLQTQETRTTVLPEATEGMRPAEKMPRDSSWGHCSIEGTKERWSWGGRREHGLLEATKGRGGVCPLNCWTAE
jgi:hypothetical protein